VILLSGSKTHFSIPDQLESNFGDSKKKFLVMHQSFKYLLGGIGSDNSWRAFSLSQDYIFLSNPEEFHYASFFNENK
jgi:hypothetical protein